MKRFIEGEGRTQVTLLPECLDDYVCEDNPVRVVDVFVEGLDLEQLGFGRMQPEATGRPAYHPSTLLKIYIYGYLNRIQSSRRLEREAQRNVELMWLTQRLAPDFKTIADFRRDNGAAIRNVCCQFVELCRRLQLFSNAVVAIDGSKFKAVNAHDRNFTHAKLEKRMRQIEACVERYLKAMDTDDRRQLSRMAIQAKAAMGTEQLVAVVIATGAEYRKPPLQNLSRFEGAGVYYGATFTEAQLCRGEEVIVVGGGNSAGQATVYLAQSARRVHVLIRSGGLAETMSRYLARRIEQNPAIDLRTHTEITALEGDGHLERVQWRNAHSGSSETHNIRHVFLMIGAVPCTRWLEGCVATDANGFIKTGPDLSPEELAAARWPLARRPHLLETSLPGVFAVGDVRAGNVKRVASGVGEGSIAISFVHQVLQE